MYRKTGVEKINEFGKQKASTQFLPTNYFLLKISFSYTMQLIHQYYFNLQLVPISPFVNVLSLQNFLTHGILFTHQKLNTFKLL